MSKLDEREWEIQASSYGISHRNKRYSIGNIASGIVIALYGDRWELHLRAQHELETCPVTMLLA